MTLLKWKFNSETHTAFKNFQLGPLKNDSTTHFDCYVTIDVGLLNQIHPHAANSNFNWLPSFFASKDSLRWGAEHFFNFLYD